VTKRRPEIHISAPKAPTLEAIATAGDGYYVQLCYTDNKHGCRRVRAFFIERQQRVGPLREALVHGRSARIGRRLQPVEDPAQQLICDRECLLDSIERAYLQMIGN